MRFPVFSALRSYDPLVHDASRASAEWAEGWQESWDRLEQRLVPDRELRIRALIDVVDATTFTSPTVLDLACGTGTVTRRLLHRLPAAHAIAVDVDPVLLAIASATFTADDRVRIVSADLRDPAWREALPVREVDAVVTATALHWLSEAVVRRLYTDLRGLVRSGGVVAHAEEMPLVEPPDRARGSETLTRAPWIRGAGDHDARWEAWWAQADADPLLHDAMVRRRAVFRTTYPNEEFSPPAAWHIAALHDAGFINGAEVWRSGTGAVVAAIRG